jgi:polyhydroxyalkanoate synthesis repressor PhaR
MASTLAVDGVVKVHLIQKYPNRRLYDRAESRYITLEDVRNLVLSGASFTIQDQRSQADITRATLLQVLLEGEQAPNSKPVLDCEYLKRIIRAQSPQGAAKLDESLRAPAAPAAPAASG